MREEAREFVMNFIAGAERVKSQYTDRWREVLANREVEPEWIRSSQLNSPYQQAGVYKPLRKQVVLKDPETHKIVMTYAGLMMSNCFGDTRREYIQAEPVGYEDVLKAQTITKLLRYVMSLPGHYRSMLEAFTDMLTFGTAIVESPWKLEERMIPARSVEINEYGEELSTFNVVPITSYDDVSIRNIDIEDFYPDPSHYRIEEMAGCAKRFRINAFEAKRNKMWDSDAVTAAFAVGSGPSSTEATGPSFRIGLDKPYHTEAPAEFREKVAYQYWGDTPWGLEKITIINNFLVEEIDWPLADPSLPFHAATINPVVGRFYGRSPAEVVRYDQSFADAIKILLAEAIIRQVHPPIIFDDAAEVDTAALKEWRADALIAARGGAGSVQTLQYGANVANGFAMLTGLKDSMQGGSGALGSTQGEAGPDRESASVGSQRYKMALSRPELACRLIEEDFLPSLGRGIVRRCQQFLDSDGVRQRCGEMPEPVDITTIMGDFDVRFVGSRMAMSRQTKLQALDRLTAMAQSMPAFQMALPTIEMASWVLGDLMELPELAAKVGEAASMQANVAAMQAAGAGGPARNGVPQAPEPVGITPEQSAGGTIQ